MGRHQVETGPAWAGAVNSYRCRLRLMPIPWPGVPTITNLSSLLHVDWSFSSTTLYHQYMRLTLVWLAVAVWQLWDSPQQTVGLGPIFALVMTGQPGLPGRAE